MHDPLQVAQEIMRVLKPGGTLVIIDIDDGLFGVIEPEMVQRLERIQGDQLKHASIMPSLDLIDLDRYRPL